MWSYASKCENTLVFLSLSVYTYIHTNTYGIYKVCFCNNNSTAVMVLYINHNNNIQH